MFLNILLVFALLAVAFASAVDQKVDAKSQAHFPEKAYMFTREPEAVHSASASSLRTSTDRKVSANIKGNEEGDYLFITYSENKGYCGGPDFVGEFYKVGECFNAGDDENGNSMGYFKATCYTDTGKVTGELYADATCTGTPLFTAKTLRNGECVSRLLAYCLKEEEFTEILSSMKYEKLNVVYKADQQADAMSGNVYAAHYAFYQPSFSRWNSVMDLRAFMKTECYPGLVPPTVAPCVDTRKARSVSVVAMSLNTVRVNLYSGFGGTGDVIQTIDYQEPMMQDSSGQWITSTYLVDGWRNKIV